MLKAVGISVEKQKLLGFVVHPEKIMFMIFLLINILDVSKK